MADPAAGSSHRHCAAGGGAAACFDPALGILISSLSSFKMERKRLMNRVFLRARSSRTDEPINSDLYIYIYEKYNEKREGNESTRSIIHFPGVISLVPMKIRCQIYNIVVFILAILLKQKKKYVPSGILSIRNILSQLINVSLFLHLSSKRSDSHLFKKKGGEIIFCESLQKRQSSI